MGVYCDSLPGSGREESQFKKGALFSSFFLIFFHFLFFLKSPFRVGKVWGLVRRELKRIKSIYTLFVKCWHFNCR